MKAAVGSGFSWRSPGRLPGPFPYRCYLPVLVDVDGKEYKLTLSSRPVRSTRALEDLRATRILTAACDYLNDR